MAPAPIGPGLAVEAASGLPLGDWFARHIFKPLGMAETGFLAPQAVGDRLVPLHARLPDGSLTPLPVSFNGGAAPEFDSGGGGLTSTAHDYLRFTRMLLNGGMLDGARVLKPETVALMTQNHIGDLRAGVLETTVPGMSSSMEWFPEMTAKWGLGFLINPETTADGRTAEQPGLGRHRQQLLLVRPGKGRHRRADDAVHALRRPGGAGGTGGVRAGGLREVEPPAAGAIGPRPLSTLCSFGSGDQTEAGRFTISKFKGSHTIKATTPTVEPIKLRRSALLKEPPVKIAGSINTIRMAAPPTITAANSSSTEARLLIRRSKRYRAAGITLVT